MSTRDDLLRRLQLVGIGSVALLTGLVALLLHATGEPGLAWRGTLGFGALALALQQVLMQLLARHVVRPTGMAAGVAERVAEGDLGLPEGGTAGARDPLTRAVVAMLARLRELVGTIRQHAHDAAAMSQ